MAYATFVKSQIPSSKSQPLPTPNSQIDSQPQIPITPNRQIRPIFQNPALEINWALAFGSYLGFGIWEWLGFGAWSLGFDYAFTRLPPLIS